MRPFMIVYPQTVDRAATGTEREQGVDVETLVVDGPEEALDLAVGLRRVGTDEVVPDVERWQICWNRVRRSAWCAWRIVNAKALSVSTAVTGW